MEYFTMILYGVDFLHSLGIIHRDLKLANIFINREENGIQVIQVADFGISKIEQQTKAANITSTMGHFTTPAYKAPELFKDPKYVPTAKVDIWAAGIILYELLTSKHPFIEKD